MRFGLSIFADIQVIGEKVTMVQQPVVQHQQVDTTCGSLLRELQVWFRSQFSGIPLSLSIIARCVPDPENRESSKHTSIRITLISL